MSTAESERLKLARELLEAFALERRLYLGATGIAVVILFGSAIYQLQAQNLATMVGLFGGGSAVAYTTSQLLRMWSDVLRVVFRDKSDV